MKCIIWEKIKQMWQDRWDGEEKGRHFQKTIKVNRVGSGDRREEVKLTRLRLGHCVLYKSLKMVGKHETGLCEECQEEESVEHVILNCRKYVIERGVMKNNLNKLGVQEFNLKAALEMSMRMEVRELINLLRETAFSRDMMVCVFFFPLSPSLTKERLRL